MENILSEKMLIFDLKTDFYKVVKLRKKREECIVCGKD